MEEMEIDDVSKAGGCTSKQSKQSEQQPQSQEVPPATAHYLCVDMSYSIRGEAFYADFVSEDVLTLAVSSDAPETRVIIWGSSADALGGVDDLVARLLDNNFTLGGTSPLCFIRKLPADGCIDLTVITDGQISDHEIEEARKELQRQHGDLRVGRLTLTYVNRQLEYMNMGLSVILGDIVLGDVVVRVKDAQNAVTSLEVETLDASAGVQDILDQHIGMDKTLVDMTKGVHHLSQRFSVADPKKKLEIRRLVRDHMQRFIREYRNKQLSANDEKLMLEHSESGEWYAVKEAFIGNVLPEGVKMVQAICQKFLNETQNFGVVRISAYAPVSIQDNSDAQNEDESSDGEGQREEPEDDDEDEVLLDDITYRALGDDAVMVLPATLERPCGQGDQNHIDAAIAFNGKILPDNILSLKTLLELRESETGQTGPLRSTADSFASNPFNRMPMSCVFLLPVNCTALPARRLLEVDRWNLNMLSRFTRCGRYLPSLPLSLAIVLERVFREWDINLTSVTDEKERTRMADRMERVRSACRAYLSEQRTPMTFTVSVAVVVEGTFRTAATLACRVLLAGCDPELPIGVLTRFWTNLKGEKEEQARVVWAALLPYAVRACARHSDDFPRKEYITLKALASGMEWKRSGRNAELRERKGLEYSISMYTKYLEHLLAEACEGVRLRYEELVIRRDLFSVPVEVPLQCLHGVEVDSCASEAHGEISLCLETGRPTLLNLQTLDMWYVRLPELRADQTTRASFSFHRALCQLVHNKKAFPEDAVDLVKFVCARARTMFARRTPEEGRGDAAGPRLLPTAPCRRMLEDAEYVFDSLARLRAGRPGLTAKEYRKMLMEPRRVCQAWPCCAFIREACSPEQIEWINAHATFKQIGGQPRILSGEVSYRNPKA